MSTCILLSDLVSVEAMSFPWKKKRGPNCSKHCELNELVKRSAHYVFYDFMTKYTEIFC